ncbi:MAG: hypothetical protein HQL32_03120 [Planctomycetes bacterium]|nr:hypothetical protein [Planctomycetota bacterium]
MKFKESIIFLILFLIHFTSFAEPKVEPEIATFSPKGEMYVSNYNGTFMLTYKGEAIKYTLDPKGKMESSRAWPFRGVYLRPKKGVYTVNPTWFNERAEEIVVHVEKSKNLEALMAPKSAKDLWKTFACRAFQDDLLPLLGTKIPTEERTVLLQKIDRAYLETALMYAQKYALQRRVKKAPKFGSLVKVLQPMMTTFAYGNPWITVAECYATSETFGRGKEVYRGYFLNSELMMVVRRRYQFPFSPKKLGWSLLQMDDGVFMEYHRECMRRWKDRGQYLFSKGEASKKVKSIPKNLRGPGVQSDLP